MTRHSRLRRFVAGLLVVPFALLGAPQAAMAGALGTQALLQAEQREAAVDRLQSMLEREDVRAMLEERGVAPEDAAERVASMTAEELAAVHKHMDELPAGGILGLIGAVFVVLIVLELMGVTNVFSKL